jgi:hypothetical protein
MLIKPSELYERDYYSWTREQARALRDHRSEDLDWEHVAEEVEDLGRSERRSLQSQMARLIAHLLKLSSAAPNVRRGNQRLWELSVRGARRASERLLHENPGLKPELPKILAAAFEDARDEALAELRLPDSAIPETSPWTLEQIMDAEFSPAPTHTSARPNSKRKAR